MTTPITSALSLRLPSTTACPHPGSLIGKLLGTSLAMTSLLGTAALAAPQASLTLKNSDAALCNHNNTEWSLSKVVDSVTGESGNQTVTWTITSTKGATSANTLQVNGFVAVQNTGTADASIGNIVVNLQRQKNIGTVSKPKWTWASVSVDAADATSGDAATAANIVAAASQEVPAYSGGAYSISSAKGRFNENAASGSLSFVDNDSNTIWAINPTQVIAPGATVNLLFTANFNNTLLAIPAGESIRAEMVVSFGGVGSRGGSGASATNIDVNGNGIIDPNENGVRSVPSRLTRQVPALEACNSQVTLTDTGVSTTGTVTYADLVSDGAPTAPVSATTSFTVTATGVSGGADGGTIGNTATLVGESDSVSVITGYSSVTVTDPLSGLPVTTQVPVYHDFACCTGVDLLASASATIGELVIAFHPGDFCTSSESDFGRTNTDAYALLAAHEALFPSGVEVGIPGAGGFSMKFQAGTELVNLGNVPHPNWVSVATTVAEALENYLPSGGGAGALNADLVNPTSSASGQFGGRVLTLKLNVALSDGLATPSGFGDLVYTHAADSLSGKTVREILAAADIAVGGGALPAGYSYNQFANLCKDLSDSWSRDNAAGLCIPSTWAVENLSVAP